MSPPCANLGAGAQFLRTELIGLVGAVHRGLARLAQSGLVTATCVGTQKNCQPGVADICRVLRHRADDCGSYRVARSGSNNNESVMGSCMPLKVAQ